MLRQSFYFYILALLLTQCYTPPKNKTASYRRIQWNILAFEDTTKVFQKNTYLWLDAEFVTQNDSVFWNSHHEGADKFFIHLLDTVQHPLFFPFYQSSEQDSLIIIAPKEFILKDIFNISECPEFLSKDSIIKCFIKIKKYFKSIDEAYLQQFQKDEISAIEKFLLKNKPLYQKDSNGIIWLEPLPIPEFINRENIKEVTVAYSGYFLDGRMIDHNDSLGIRYDDTLQLIKGLNYVIKRLEFGKSAKIILPSPLAFGSRGSLNKTIPPFTPLLYEINLLQNQ